MPPHRLALTLCFGLSASPAAAGARVCKVDPFQLFFGSDVATHMVVTSGVPCGVSFIQGGPGRTVNAGGINRIAVAEQATHGRAGTSGMTAWGYQSQKGYAGKDRFVIEAGGEILYNRVIRGTSRIAVDVDVVP